MTPFIWHDGHPALTVSGRKLLNKQDEHGHLVLRDEVVDWLKEHVGFGRFQIHDYPKLHEVSLVFLEEADRFHFMMRWR